VTDPSCYKHFFDSSQGQRAPTSRCGMRAYCSAAFGEQRLKPEKLSVSQSQMDAETCGEECRDMLCWSDLRIWLDAILKVCFRNHPRRSMLSWTVPIWNRGPVSAIQIWVSRAPTLSSLGDWILLATTPHSVSRLPTATLKNG
jgi:hypothetical protein